jgi:hypothetical protein
VGFGVVSGVALIVFERHRAAGNIENEDSESTVVVFPAAIKIVEILPRNGFDGRLEVVFGTRGFGSFADKLNPGLGRKRQPFVGGTPSFEVLDLAGIAGAVIVDGDAVNAGCGERSCRSFWFSLFIG